MDEEILNTVHSMFGSGVEIVDCIKSSSVLQEETLMINGVPVKLDGMSGDDANAIKAALLEGQMPSVDLLNQLLFQAGLLRQPVQLETSLSVKSCTTTTEEVLVSRNGLILDERTSKTNENYVYKSDNMEILQPILKKDFQKLRGNNSRECDINYTARSTTQVESDKASQKSATFGESVGLNYRKGAECLVLDDKAKILQSASNSTVGEYCDKSSTISNYSNYTFSDATTIASSASSSSLKKQATDSSIHYLGSNSNISRATAAAVGDSSEERSNISCDSGHDGIFHSVSQSAAWPTWRRGTTAGNSLSSCYDIPSSSDEAEIVQKESLAASLSTKVEDIRCHRSNKTNKEKYEYRKPQTNYYANDAKESLPEEQSLVYCNNILVSGSLDSLIMHLVPNKDYYPDSEFEFTFLLSARLLVPPHELLGKISKIWEIQQSQIHRVDTVDNSSNVDRLSGKAAPNAIVADPNPRLKSVSNIVRLLSQWIDTFPHDFCDERLMQEVRLLTKKCVNIEPTLHDQVSCMLQKLIQLLSTLVEHEKFLSSSEQHNASSSASEYTDSTISRSQTSSQVVQEKSIFPLNSITNNVTSNFSGIIDACANPVLLAHQLTAIELEHLSHIGPEEFLKAFAKDFKQNIDNDMESLKNTIRLDAKKTRNLEAYVEWFNRLSYLTATEIVKCQKKKQRIRLVEYWIETARECFNIGNFNSLMAILAGLNLSAVSRLKKTWSKVQSAKFSVLEHQMDPTSNFNTYRSTMKAAEWRSEGARDERERLIIPFFTLFVKDLYFLNESCSTKLPNNNINFEKCSHFAQEVRKFNKWNQVVSPYEKLPNVILFIQRTDVFTEVRLSLASFSCELPENAEEKECYKKLKSETKI